MAGEPNRYRYSQAGFQRSIISAAGLTAIISFLVWLFARLAGYANAMTITLVVAVLFFSFCSAAMIWRFLRREVVLAVRPDGLFDARLSRDAMLWEDIRELRLSRAENDFRLTVQMWGSRKGSRERLIDLEPLDADVNTILQAIAAHRDIVMERA